MKLLLATNNKHKLEEIEKRISDNSFIELLCLKDVTSENIEIDETELTLEGNAQLKAEIIFEKFKISTISDDTGLEVFELNNEPGVFSARYAGIHGNDKLNRIKLLDSLGYSVDRRARFRTVICLKTEKETKFIEGICPGRITFEEVGDKGFGYDSIFIPDGYNITFAEMELSEKNKISHRAKAIENLLKYLKEN